MNIFIAVILFFVVGLIICFLWYDVIQKYDLLEKFAEWFGKRRLATKVLLIGALIDIILVLLATRPFYFEEIIYDFFINASAMCLFADIFILIDLFDNMNKHNTHKIKHNLIAFVIVTVCAIPSMPSLIETIF